MNVLITNEQDSVLSNIDIDIIKSIHGEFSSTEIIDMFKNLFYNKMILDITALKDNTTSDSYSSLAQGLDLDKLILYLPKDSIYCTPSFLSNLVTMGFYNFTSNIDGIKFLLERSNTYKDVSSLQKTPKKAETGAIHTTQAVNISGATTQSEPTKVESDKPIVVGIKNATLHAGATSLIYMMVKDLTAIYGKNKVLAIELDKKDFEFFKLPNMISGGQNDILGLISSNKNAKIILIDLNGTEDFSMCDEVIHLLEPSTIGINKMISRNKLSLEKLKGKKVMLNKSMLSNKDVEELENESGLQFFFNMPPLNDRIKNDAITNLLDNIGMINVSESSGSGNKIFGLFRR